MVFGASDVPGCRPQESRGLVEVEFILGSAEIHPVCEESVGAQPLLSIVYPGVSWQYDGRVT